MGGVAGGRVGRDVGCFLLLGDDEGGVLGEGDVGGEPVEEGHAGVVAGHVRVDHCEDEGAFGGAGEVGGADGGGFEEVWLGVLEMVLIDWGGEGRDRDVPARGIILPGGLTLLVPNVTSSV